MAVLSVAIFTTLLGLAFSAPHTCNLDEDGRAEKSDVLILGAGMAGIAAARTLEVNGVTDFLVLEASDRVGGRLFEPDGTSIELGANWIHGLDLSDPEHHPVWREWMACDEDGPGGSPTPDLTAVYDSAGNQLDIKDENGHFLTREKAFFKAYDAVFDLDLSTEVSLKQGLARAGWEASDSLDNFIEWNYLDLEIGVGPENVSAVINSQLTTYTDFTESDEDTDDYLVADERGYSFVVRCMARNFLNDRVRLNSTVTIVRVADNCVCAGVKDEDKLYCASYAIITFSAGVLQAAVRGDRDSIVQFNPPLPQWKQDAINSITPVFYGRIFLTFSTRFWNETNVDQQILGYISNQRGYYAYHILDKNLPNTIIVDVTEGLAIKIATQSKEETVNEVMTIIRKIFNNNSLPDPERSIISKWNTNPLFLHAYSAFGPGVPETVFVELLKPVNGQLYFAGEALNNTNFGTTQGAYGTGVYAAERIAEDSAGE